MNSILSFFIAFLIAVAISVGLAVLALVLVEYLTGDQSAAMAVTAGVLILSFVTALLYALVFLTTASSLRDDQQSKSLIAKRYRWRKDRKIQTMQIQVGFVYAMISGSVAENLGAPSVVVWGAICVCGLVGAAIGQDIKRRLLRRVQDSEQEQD